MNMFICGGESGTHVKRRTGCPDPLHDWPEPIGYTDAHVEATWRLNHGWRQRKCGTCGRYGWLPGRRTEKHVRRECA